MSKLFLIIIFICVLIFSCGNLKNEIDSNIINDTIAEEDIGFTIPFELVSGRIIVSTKLNGKVLARFTIDNGVNELLLTETFAERYKDSLGIVLHPNVEAAGSFLIAPAHQCYVASGDFHYDFGDSIFVNYNKYVYVINGKYTDNFACILKGDEIIQGLHGVVGIIPMRSFSKNGIVKINFDKKRLEFPEVVDSLAVPYKFDDISSIVDFPVEIFDESTDKSYVLSTTLDLGCYYNICMLRNKKVDRMFKNIPDNYCVDMEVEEDHFRDYLRWFKNVRMGMDSVVFNNIEVVCHNVQYGRIDALVGIGVMSKYDVFFDYKNSYVYMKPLEKEYDMIALKDFSIVSGLKMRQAEVNGSLKVVVGIILDGYRKVDIKLKDTILKIDNISLSNIHSDSIYKILNDKSIPNKSITVKRGDKVLVLNRNK